MGAHLVMGAVQGPGAMVPQVHDGASLACCCLQQWQLMVLRSRRCTLVSKCCTVKHEHSL